MHESSTKGHETKKVSLWKIGRDNCVTLRYSYGHTSIVPTQTCALLPFGLSIVQARGWMDTIVGEFFTEMSYKGLGQLSTLL